MRAARLLAFAASSLLAAACVVAAPAGDDDNENEGIDGISGGATSSGSGGGNSTATSTGTSMVSSTGVQLEALSSRVSGVIDGETPSTGNAFLIVEIRLTNVLAASPLYADSGFFNIETNNQLIVSDHYTTSYLASGCEGSLGLAVGGSTTCEISFEMPSGETPAKITFEDSDNQSAESTIPEPAPVCSSVATKTQGKCYGFCDPCFQVQQDLTEVCSTDELNCLGPCLQNMTTGAFNINCGCMDSCTAANSACALANDLFLSCINDSCTSPEWEVTCQTP